MSDSILCLNIDPALGLSAEEQICQMRDAGFGAFFTAWDTQIAAYRALSRAYGMLYQSVHAPFDGAAKIWQADAAGDAAAAQLTACVRDCAQNEIPLTVMHPYIGFGQPYVPTDCGVARFRAIAEEAARLGVRIALENVEGEEYLARLMRELSDLPNVGFCWDSGHESCYNCGRDMLALYGDRLFGTHLNDNVGVRGDAIIYTDDLHLLPFDGTIDWAAAAARLNRCGYNGILTFELKKSGMPERARYDSLSAKEYITLCGERAARFAALKNTI